MRRLLLVLPLINAIIFFILAFCFTMKSKDTGDTVLIDPQALYNGINETYYNNSLPRNAVVKFGEDPDQKKGQLIYGVTYHDIGTHNYRILISKANHQDEESEEFTVFHEACHVYVDEGKENNSIPKKEESHGGEWQNCMLRLANAHAFNNLW